MSVLAKRLKEARQHAGWSQEKLGIEAGLDPMSASTRMNRYELGKRTPDLQLVERIASVLKMPASYFYAVDDDEAELLLAFHRLPKKQRMRVIAFANEIV
ncbi:helix-turn-helix domain-containing protein [Ralstonia pseudosolanacearum]|uniref:helix-turn-helix domain-containing protein n=1 Tax=Ralstonia pseudosolanacearum TaxID=1310165 RepID=UPI002676F856|nr:helix-turn-helix transcriptional regulator [Ralstonia pseudosolanacearum]MDO3519090.1 helix-turn-helix transcriptional regulator [Ralstonia pseudosolanacearum]MDO3544395.1 helix-turn-helix transcriptional regulator [Ralstonia pseudosolanacearum]